MAKPALILVGADKGGVGKTTVARTLLDYFTAHNVPTRAFDTETPKGTLKRFHRDVSEVLDVTAVADQMRIIDTLSTTDATVTVVDVRDGLMSPVIDLGQGLFDQFFKVMTEIGFEDEARQKLIQPVVLFIADSAPFTATTYADLRGGIATDHFCPGA